MKKRVVNIIAELLINEGVEHIFGVTGKTIAPFLDALLDYKNISFISAKHESGAALMAYGYAQGSRKLGVCCGSTGGGSTNLATGVATAYMNSVPMLVFTGQISTAEFGKGAFQESTGYGQSIDTVGFFKSIAKESFSLINPRTAADSIKYAIRSATSGRMGPVHINIPFDVQLAEADFELLKYRKEALEKEFLCESKLMTEAIGLIEKAHNPVFLVGWGGVQSGAGKEIIDIAERLNVPVATSIQGKGAIPTSHPLCLGIVGICGHPVAADYVFEKSDLLIAVGTSFSEFSTYSWDERFLKHKKIIQIDIDSREIGKNFTVETGLTGDARVIISQMNQKLASLNIQAKTSGDEVKKMIKTQGRLINPQMMDDNTIPIKPQRLMKEIGKYAPADTLFLADSSSHWAWAMHYLPVGERGGFYPTLGLGAMGASICSAIGLKLSKPANPVICICGDGSFLMSGNEIATAEQYSIPVIWVVFNDSKYNMPEFSIRKMFNRTIGVELGKNNFAKYAEALNVKGYRIETPEELTEALAEAVSLNRAVVLDVVVDSSEIPPLGQRKLKSE